MSLLCLVVAGVFFRTSTPQLGTFSPSTLQSVPGSLGMESRAHLENEGLASALLSSCADRLAGVSSYRNLDTVEPESTTHSMSRSPSLA